MATHSGILAWKIPWTAEPGGLEPLVSHRGTGWQWVPLRDLGVSEQGLGHSPPGERKWWQAGCRF